VTATACNPGCRVYGPDECRELTRYCGPDECRCAQVIEHEGSAPAESHVLDEGPCPSHGEGCILHAGIHYKMPRFVGYITDLRL
jgi:hypothetical protein